MICAYKCILNKNCFTSHNNGLWHVRGRPVCDAVCLWLIHSRQALWWHITSAWEVWPVGDKRAQSLISDSSLLSDWPSPHQSSALLSAPAVILTILSHTVEMLRSTEFQRAFVLSANPCASHILSASGPNCVFTLMSSSSTVLARCQRQIIPDFSLWGETVSLWLTTA